MRIAFISDVHGNYPALKNVVDDAVSNNVDRIVFVGDYIFDLPFSNEVVRLLMELKNAHIIKGNKEAYLDGLKKDNQNNWIYNQMGAIYQTYRELPNEACNFLNDLDDECRIQINSDIDIYATHIPTFSTLSSKTNYSSSNFHKRMIAKPFSHEQYLQEFADFVNRDDCKSIINRIDSNIIVFGHNHLQSYAYCGDKLIINPGSCGQPLDFNTTAAYTILEETAAGLNVIEKRVAYDIEYTINQAKKSMIYEKGRTWSDLVFLALRTGKDYFGLFFEIARQIQQSKNEKDTFFSNSTWDEARRVFANTYKEFEC